MLKTLSTVEEIEARRPHFCGYLFQFYRFGPFGKLSGWRKQYVCLAPSSSNVGASSTNLHEQDQTSLSLFFFHVTPGGSGNEQQHVKFRTELALEQGCEARENYDATREDTFLVITSKQQLRLQATSAESRKQWVDALSTEFQKQVGTSLMEQKTVLLRTGSEAFTWHQNATTVLAKQRLVVVGSSPSLLKLGPAEGIALKEIDSVEAGNFHASCESLKQAFHFNCFVVKLKRNKGTLDIECDKQSTRDDWVSALGAFLAGDCEVPLLPPVASAGNPAASVEVDELLAATRRLKSPPPSSNGKKKTLEPTSNANTQAAAEFFKQKYAMKSDFPYSECISTALQFALGQPGSTAELHPPVRAVSKEDMDQVVTHPKFKLANSSNNKSTAYELQEYAPRAFRELRNRWGVCDTAFLDSVSALSGDGAVGDGKSGMLFFFTRDRRFVLKTVKPNEMQVLSDFLRAYIKHMVDWEDTLICRFFGLYTFKFPGQQAISLVCMQNSFDTRLVLHEKYDLKGSTRNRWCTPRFGAVLKDLNFGTSKLYLDSEDRAALLDQCERDTLLMEQFNVMDYSLLLGIHKAEPDEKGRRNLVLLNMANQLEPVHVRPNRWQRDFGGIEGFNPETKTPEVYIMCVIDLLQAYDFGKKAENLIKSQMTEVVSEISSVNPKTYRARFLAYLAKIIVGTEGQNVQIQAQRKEIKLKVFAGAGGRPNTVRMSAPVVVDAPPSSSQSKATGGKRMEEVSVEDAPAPVLVASPPAAAAAAAKPNRTSDTVTNPILLALLDQDHQVEEGSLDEDQLKTEILRAVAEAQEIKSHAVDASAAYTEILEDGTEITILDNGGFIQRAPNNGVVIHMFPDGSKRQIDPDGSTIDVSAEGEITCHLPDGTEIVHLDDVDTNVVDLQRNPDGSVIETWRDGTQIQRNQDGSRIETYSNGDKRTVFADGVVVEEMGSGAVRQISPDGITILSMTNGTRIQTDSRNPHQILTTFPDGSLLQEDKSDGMVIRTFVDGSEFHSFPDGTVIEYLPSGYSKQTNKDGTVIETFPDGRILQTGRDGQLIERRVVVEE